MIIGKNSPEVISKESRDPIAVSFIASSPRPSRSILCPGSTDNTESESGAPNKILGMKSKKLWTTAIAIIAATSDKLFVLLKKSRPTKNIAATVFI